MTGLWTRVWRGWFRVRACWWLIRLARFPVADAWRYAGWLDDWPLYADWHYGPRDAVEAEMECWEG